MSENTLLSPLNTRLVLVFMSMLAIMSVYELAKQTFHPDISIWESHTITIAFTSLIAVFIAYFPLRSPYREKQRSDEAFRHQLDAEESLRRSEARYRSFVESAGDAIYTVDPDLRYLMVNTRHPAKKRAPARRVCRETLRGVPFQGRDSGLCRAGPPRYRDERSGPGRIRTGREALPQETFTGERQRDRC